MKRISAFLVALAMVFGLTDSAHAALIVRGTDTSGNQLIYDDDLDITWYDFTHTFASWDGQMAWAGGLEVTFNGFTYTDWRLPFADESCGTGPCSTGELGHLFHVELSDPSASKAPFEHLFNFAYWTGTEYSGNPGSTAWAFAFDNGSQFAPVKNPASSFGCKFCFGIAVRGGDVSAGAPLPEPGTLFLLGSGLVGLVGSRRRFQQNETERNRRPFARVAR